MTEELAPRHAPSPGLTPALGRNIQALVDRRKREETTATTQQKVAASITRFTGSKIFRCITARRSRVAPARPVHHAGARGR